MARRHAAVFNIPRARQGLNSPVTRRGQLRALTFSNVGRPLGLSLLARSEGNGMDEEMLDRLAIRSLVENWAVWRDAGAWERFRSVWHDDGRMMATWFQGTVDEFIAVSRAGFDKGVSILHFLGGHSADLNGNRAIAQTKMTISQRAVVHDVLVDVVCTGRFYDFLEKRSGRWALVLRQPIYEKDRMEPVDPAAKVSLDKALLERFPEGYRHLAYLQTNIGYKVKPDMPGLKGSEVEALYASGRAWLGA
jgi:SnoaL-like domain